MILAVYFAIQVSEARSELSKVHLAHSSSLRELQAVMEAKTGELERAMIEKTLLERQVSSLKEEQRETKEDHGLQVSMWMEEIIVCVLFGKRNMHEKI